MYNGFFTHDFYKFEYLLAPSFPYDDMNTYQNFYTPKHRRPVTNSKMMSGLKTGCNRAGRKKKEFTDNEFVLHFLLSGEKK